MTRASPGILPFCQHCGKYKGVGQCQNPDCDKSASIEIESKSIRSITCAICSDEGISKCSICDQMYCIKHCLGVRESQIITIDQHIGTCIICGELVCEQCWIFNKQGEITCLKHLEN